jgi:hypothetical protein
VAERKKKLMNQQHVFKVKRLSGGIFDFMEYKKKKPFFPKPFNLRLGSPINETFHMKKNIVYKEKQILVLTNELNSEEMIFVEAKIENGQLVQVMKLEDEYLEGLSSLFRDII